LVCLRETPGVEIAAAEGSLPEQITEQAIEKLEDDRFGHDDFVQRLLKIISGTRTPANIALFGRWGSGKTGIANRLKSEVKKSMPGVKFVIFDAFKFARLPLLRRFLVQLAKELGGPATASEYRDLVYERKENTHLNKLTKETKDAFVKWALWSIWILAALLVGLDLLVLALPFDREQILFDGIDAVLGILAPAGLLGGVLVFAARYLTASTTTEMPSSEEQFEHLFAKLLKGHDVGIGPDKKKLVVFIDELDRASASEVAEALESLKAFLGLPGCVFIVAADQAVLEHALRQQARQATPHDVTNPYYSSGSAYLDKVFQYQITLPPLFPGRLTGFALELLAEVGGVWDEVDNKEEVVSVLLPVNVRSPRRVKVLLNAFAQAFALALARAESKKLDRNVKRRADELAKLVGLQTEFPLFAADLAFHRDLPMLVLACADALSDGGDANPMSLAPMEAADQPTRNLALGYAEGRFAPDLTLDRGAEAGDQAKRDNEEDSLRRAQGTALIDYLRQTERVEGPKTDLVHLEGLGLASGIDENLASELEDLAFRNRPERVREILEELPDDERRRATLRLLELIRTSRGNDADNAIRALLIAFPAASKSIHAISKALVSAVAQHGHRPGLAQDELTGALEFAVAADDRGLQRLVLRREEALTEPLRLRALDLAPSLVARHAKRLGQALLAEIVANPDETGQRIELMSPKVRAPLIRSTAAELSATVDRLEARLKDETLDEAVGASTIQRLEEIVAGIVTTSQALNPEAQEATEVLLAPLLRSVRRESLQAEIEAVLEKLQVARERNFNLALARWLSHRPTSTFTRLSPKLDPGALEQGARDELGEILARLWLEAVGGSADAREGIVRIAEIRRGGAAVGLARLEEEIRASFAGAVTNHAEAEQQQDRFALLRAVAKEDLIQPSLAADILLEAAERTLASSPGAEQGAEIAKLLQGEFAWAAPIASEARLQASREALASSPWIASFPPVSEILQLQVEAALSRGQKRPSSPFKSDAMLALAESHGTDFIPGIALWLQGFHPQPRYAIKVLAPYLGTVLSSALAAAVEAYREGLSPAGCYRMVHDQIASPPQHRRLNGKLLVQLGIQDADSEKVADAIVERFKHAHNETGRKDVMTIWRAFAPQDAKIRRKLIKEVFIPLSGEGTGAYELSRKNLDLCQPPPRGTKRELRKALAKSPNKESGRKMAKRMQEVGL
jgi:DNA-binding transcriptional ArsR family regulator